MASSSGITSQQAGFAAAVLRGIGAPPTPRNIAGFIGWSQAEGGDNWQRNNPLNTTLSAPGTTRTINSAGVKAYATPQAGVAATVQTLRNGRYGGIISAFKANNPNALGPAIGGSPWGTSGSLAAQTIAQTLGQPIPSAGSLPASPAAAGGPSFASTGPSVQFDQAAFDRAKQAAIAGQYLAQSAKSAGMWQTGPKSTIPVPSLIAPGLLSTKTPNVADYQTSSAAQTSLQQLAGPTNLNVHPGSLPPGAGDVNPLAHGWKLGRTDQGVDANAAPGTPILAINDSVVKQVIPNWYSGQPLVLLQLTSGPNAGKYWYVSEQIAGTPRVGQQIARGQIVARYASQGTGIEIGWGSPSSAGRTLAQAQGPLPAGHANTPAGMAFRQQILGA